MRRAQQGRGHDRALDVPTGPALHLDLGLAVDRERRLPEDVAVLLDPALPQGEVADRAPSRTRRPSRARSRRSFRASICRDWRACRRSSNEADPVVDRAVVGEIGVPLVEQRLDHLHHAVLRRPWRGGSDRLARSSAERVACPRETGPPSASVNASHRSSSAARRVADDLVLDVRDVLDVRRPRSRTRAASARRCRSTSEERPVADVDVAVHGRSAGVDRDACCGSSGSERLHAPGQAVVEVTGAWRAPRDHVGLLVASLVGILVLIGPVLRGRLVVLR